MLAVSTKVKRASELTIEKKKEVLDLLEKKISQRKLSKQFGVSKTTIWNIGKNRTDILNIYKDNYKNNNRKRRLRKTENDEINDSVLEFFQFCRTNNIQVTGSMLQKQAKEIAKRLNNQNFRASNGWLNAFTKRHDIKLRINSTNYNNNQPLKLNSSLEYEPKMCSNNGSVETKSEPLEPISNKFKNRLKNILKDYAIKDQFCIVDTVLLYRQIPTKNSQESLNNLEKTEKLIVLLCCSASGEKLKPLIIGNQPPVDVNVDYLPLTWRTSKTACTNARIFNEWLYAIDEKMRSDDRKIIVFVENNSSHAILKDLYNIKIEYFPTNYSRGIVKLFKINYRKNMLKYLFATNEHCNSFIEFNNSITTFDALRWIDQSWRSLSQQTIQNHFRPNDYFQPFCFIDNDPSLFELNQMVQALSLNLQNELLPPKSMLMFEDSIKMYDDGDCADIKEEDAGIQHPLVTHQEALYYIKQLLSYTSNNNNVELFDQFYDTYNSIETLWINSRVKGPSNGLNPT